MYSMSLEKNYVTYNVTVADLNVGAAGVGLELK